MYRSQARRVYFAYNIYHKSDAVPHSTKPVAVHNGNTYHALHILSRTNQQWTVFMIQKYPTLCVCLLFKIIFLFTNMLIKTCIDGTCCDSRYSPNTLLSGRSSNSPPNQGTSGLISTPCLQYCISERLKLFFNSDILQNYSKLMS